MRVIRDFRSSVREVNEMASIESKKIKRAFLVCIFLLMLLGSFLTPYAADDWTYMYSWATGERIAGIGDIFASMAAHAQRLNGRLIAHFLAQLFLWLPKAVFNIVNAAAFTALIALLADLASPKGKINDLVLFLIFAAVWIFVPSFGEVFFWLIGSCNYGWGCLLGLFFLAPYMRLLERDEKRPTAFWLLWMIPSFLAGAYLENVSVGCIFLSALLLILRRIFCKKRSGILPVLPILTAVGGLLCMLACPAESDKTGTFSLLPLGKGVIAALLEYSALAVPIIAFAVLFTLAVYFHARRERLVLAAALFAGSLCSAFVLSAAAYIPGRCLAFSALLLILADAMLLDMLSEKKTRLLVLCTAAAVTLPLLYWGVYGFADITNGFIAERTNETAITEAASRGETSVTVPEAEARTRYSVFYELKYLDTETAHTWPNESMAQTLGVAEILGTYAEDGPTA